MTFPRKRHTTNFIAWSVMKTEPLRLGEQFSVCQAVPFEVNFEQTNREISHRLRRALTGATPKHWRAESI